MSKTPKISIKGLYKGFAGNPVLKGLDLDIRAGESVVVIGGSGTGKSVLVKCILGLMTPDAGEILIDGGAIAAGAKTMRDEFMKKVGMLFQGGALFDSLSVWENWHARQRPPCGSGKA